MHDWNVIPDIIGDGASEQEEIMTAICETKGATFDGADCVGELDDSIVYVSKNQNIFWEHFLYQTTGVPEAEGSEMRLWCNAAKIDNCQ